MINKKWESLTENEQTLVVGFFHVATLAKALTDKLGEDAVKGSILWATHKSSSQWNVEKEFHAGGLGQFVSADWFIGYYGRDVLGEDSDTEEITVVVCANDAFPSLETDLDTLLTVAEEVFNVSGLTFKVNVHNCNSPGGDA